MPSVKDDWISPTRGFDGLATSCSAVHLQRLGYDKGRAEASLLYFLEIRRSLVNSMSEKRAGEWEAFIEA